MSGPLPPVRLYHVGSHKTDFPEIWCWRFLWTSRENTICLKSYKYIEHCTWRPQYVYIVDSSKKYFVAPQQCRRNHCCFSVATLVSFTLLTVTCRSAIQKTSCSLELWLGGRAKMLHFTYTLPVIFRAIVCYQESVSLKGPGRDKLDWVRSGICLFGQNVKTLQSSA
jgi:hypothetical protein